MNREKLHPTDLACFGEVAKVIGYDSAVIELQRVIDSNCRLDMDKSIVVRAFDWGFTPQGRVFWNDIDDGYIPKGYTAPAAKPLEESPAFTDLSKDSQEHFLKLIEAVGYPPEDATHVDFDGGYFLDCERWLKIENGLEYFWANECEWELAGEAVQSTKKYPIPQKPWYDPSDVGFKNHPEEEYTGGSVSYYKVEINNPTTIKEPYTAECNDIIEALQMNYAEGNAFKAIWRKCAARLGSAKKGYTDGLYDSEKVVFFGQRMVEQCKAENKV